MVFSVEILDVLLLLRIEIISPGLLERVEWLRRKLTLKLFTLFVLLPLEVMVYQDQIDIFIYDFVQIFQGIYLHFLLELQTMFNFFIIVQFAITVLFCIFRYLVFLLELPKFFFAFEVILPQPISLYFSYAFAHKILSQSPFCIHFVVHDGFLQVNRSQIFRYKGFFAVIWGDVTRFSPDAPDRPLSDGLFWFCKTTPLNLDWFRFTWWFTEFRRCCRFF